jgi:hypothetical protein
MSQERKVLLYGGSGYTGRLVAESLAQRNIPFYLAGRNRTRLENALAVVEERHGAPVDAEFLTVDAISEELLAMFKQVDIVINVAGPFMQIAWPVVEAALAGKCHYLDTSGEQDWTNAIKQKYGQAFADEGLLLCPANAYMWTAGALAAEVVLETEGVDTLEILYQLENAIPSDASTRSFLRMQCNDTSQYYLEQNEFKVWPNDKAFTVNVPYRAQVCRALPWGGACEPIWYADDSRVRNCTVLTAVGEDIIDGTLAACAQFNELSPGMSQEEKEQLTNQIGEQLSTGEPQKDDLDVQRSRIVCYGRSRQICTKFVLTLSAPYTWTGEMCAEAAQRLLDGKARCVGFQSAAKAFGHRELLKVFHERGFCNLPG